MRAAIGVAIALQVLLLWRLTSAPRAASLAAPAEASPTRPVAATTAPAPSSDGRRPPSPRFIDFPATATFAGKPAPVDLDSAPDARMFRTRLRAGAAEGPNFAGDQTVVTWGCGTNCQVVAIVDARSGRVYFPGIISETGLAFRRDSRLLIENPADSHDVRADERAPRPDDEGARLFGGPNFYAWNGTSLVPILVDDTFGLPFPAWAR